MQNLTDDLHPRNITELVKRTISLLVLNEFVCLVEKNSISNFFSACGLQEFMYYLYVYN